MKLYFSPGACSVAAHIVLEEMGTPYQTVKVDLGKKTTPEGDYNQINPKSYVPALQLDDGQILTEDAIILQYLADQKPEMNLAPKMGTMERYRFMETLHFIATELHKGFGPLFSADRTMKNKEGIDELKAATRARVSQRFHFFEKDLGDREYAFGTRFTVADAYLVTILRWAHSFDFDMKQWPRLESYYQRMKSRPSVQKTFTDEGLH